MIPELSNSHSDFAYLEEIGVFRFSLDYLTVYLDLNLLSLLFVIRDVPAGESCFALPVLQQDKSDLKRIVSLLQKAYHF